LQEGHYEAPGNATEEQLANIWVTLLKMKKVSIRDNFFDLGGNSFMAIQIITLIGNTFKVKISIKDLFENPSIEALARLIDAQESKFENSLLHTPVSDNYPLTEIQKAYWLASQQDNVSVSYNTTLGWSVKAAIDLDKIEQAFRLLLDRHEILRYIIDYDEKGELRFYLQDPARTGEGFLVVDMGDEPVDEQGAIRLFDEENKFLFDFRNGPLMRIKIIRNTPTEYFIFFNTHHIISDPFSLQIIFNDLLLSYHYLQQGRSGVLQPAPEFSFRDYAWSLAVQAREEDQLKSENFWRTYLSGRQAVVKFPGARTLAAPSNQAGVVKLLINEKGLVNALRNYNREHQGTMFVMWLSLVKTLIYLETGQQDLSFGCPVNSRNNHELSNIVGLFLNTIIVRSVIAEDPDFAALYETVKTATVSALAHSEYPFLKLAVIEGAETGKGGGEFNIGFNLNPKVPTRNINYPGFDFRPLQKKERYVKADIWVDITELEDTVSFEVSYRKEVFEESYISALLDKLKYLVKHCLADSHLKLSFIKALVEVDQKQAKDTRMKHQRESNLKKLKKHL
jgi:acyl carrier protein